MADDLCGNVNCEVYGDYVAPEEFVPPEVYLGETGTIIDEEIPTDEPYIPEEPVPGIPKAATNFTASGEGLCSKIRFEWTNVPGATYSVLDGENEWHNVTSGFTIDTVWQDRWFQIRTWNAAGHTNGPKSTASAVICGDTSGSMEWESGTHEWICPTGVTEATICMIGGGGSGALSIAEEPKFTGGGFAGVIFTHTFSVVPTQVYSLTVGNGAAKMTWWSEGSYNGMAGQTTTFGGFTAAGGSGGGLGYVAPAASGYNGNGMKQAANCKGAYTDGIKNGYAYGGQAGFGKGGDGSHVANTIDIGAEDGTRGSGGGGFCLIRDSYSTANNWSGGGGNGYIKLSW
ncbi:MAG: hypothetical protein DRG59_12180 [Deltaproteobacteria bacterium]|nr:MAG: hypothetical protein DRG59_12180 [Deltaproteobacteria bacterium]